MGMSELITPNSGYYHGYRNGDSVTGDIFYRMNTNARSIAGTYAGDIVPHGPAYIRWQWVGLQDDLCAGNHAGKK